jgi:hypothetical protein
LREFLPNGDDISFFKQCQCAGLPTLQSCQENDRTNHWKRRLCSALNPGYVTEFNLFLGCGGRRGV